MTYRTKLILTALLFLVAAMGALLYLRADYVGICPKGDRSCYDVFDVITNTLFTLALGVVPMLFILAFLSKEVFTAWFKFARIYIPFFVLFIMLDSGGDGNSLGIDSEEFYGSLLGFAYFVVSLILIIRVHRRVKREAKGTNSNPFPMGGQKPV